MSGLRTILATTTLIVTTAAWSASALAVCIPNPFPNDWLTQQEAPNVAAAAPPHGGHTIDEHVDKTDQDLIDRVQYEGVSADGTFATTAAAQATITNRLATRTVAINNWAAGARRGAPPRVDNFRMAGTIGRVAFWNNANPPAVVVRNTCTFRTVIRPLGGGECFLLTAYPKKPQPADNCPQ